MNGRIAVMQRQIYKLADAIEEVQVLAEDLADFVELPEEEDEHDTRRRPLLDSATEESDRGNTSTTGEVSNERHEPES